MRTYEGTINSNLDRLFTKEDIIKIIAIITLNYLPNMYSIKTIESWVDDSISSLERMKRLSYNEKN